MRKAITNIQKSEIRLELTAVWRDKVILSNEYDIFPLPVVSRQVGTGRGRSRGHGQTSSSQRIVLKQSSKLPKKYHFSDIPYLSQRLMVSRGPSVVLKGKRRYFDLTVLTDMPCLTGAGEGKK